MEHLDDLKRKLLEFRDQRDWKQFHDPKNLAISLSLEAAEVLELFQWTKNNEINEGKEEQFSEELADVLIYTLLLAESCDIDLIKAAKDKIELNKKRYPIEKSKGISKKHTEI